MTRKNRIQSIIKAENILVHPYSQSPGILTENLSWQKIAPLLPKKCLVYSETHIRPSHTA